MRLSRHAAAIPALVFLALPALAAAQEPVRDFAQLNTRLRPGDTIWVTDAKGREVKGTIVDVTPGALILKADGSRSYASPDVRLIRQRRPDSLISGAIIGAIPGALLGIAMGNFSGEWDPGDAAVGALIFGGIGAGIGVGIDALIPGKKLVAYRAPGTAGAPHARLSIAPVVTPRAKGVAVTLSF